jgi:hypothetical protein
MIKKTVAALLFILVAGGLAANERQMRPYRFTHESFNSQQLVKLRATADFIKYVSAGRTEYEKMLLLKDWVYSNLKYSFESPVPELLDSLEIMKLRDDGTTFLCVSYAALYLQCSLSLGWTARYIFLRSPSNKQHAAVDVWSNQYKKWIYMDPTWNMSVEEKGVPMSILEIRQRWLNKKFSSMRFVFSGGEKAKRFKNSKFPFRGGNSELWRKRPVDTVWLSYVNEVSVVDRNDLFNFTSPDIYPDVYVIKDKRNQKAVKKRQHIPAKALFAPCNMPSYAINKIKDDPINMEIKLTYNTKKSFTPSFDHFEIENEDKWITSDSKFVAPKIQLRTGIKMRAVNVLGVAGPVVVIKNK